MDSAEFSTESDSTQWQPLDSLQRRVLGVLVEKAKTTPDSYPLTVNAIKTGSNQKSNRNPQMDLDADDVMATLDELREMGAVSEVQGDGRVSKYRHRAYDWFGVDKMELAVLTELMLRGEQTVGELRGRAARMEPISGIAELRPILSSLREKRLLVEVTAAGRGQIVTHGLYLKGEGPEIGSSKSSSDSTSPSPTGSQTPMSASTSAPRGTQEESAVLSGLESRIAQLESRVSELEQRVSDNR